jgi:hypothetical protein
MTPAMATPAFAQNAGGAPEKDRRAILAMAGDFRVRFDFRETVPFVAGYTPIKPSVTLGTEIVRVIEDRGGLIRLQHILAMDDKEKPIVIKHWRQDWTYQPRSVLQYQRMNEWRMVDVAPRDGAWSQTVWQTDDSPRYGGIGVWEHSDGVSAWTSEPTLRPLARRDATRHPPYDHYRGINRHAITPSGWVHEQDNAKIGARDGVSATFVHETVLNTYTRATDCPIKAGDGYWARTSAYWAAVRAEWDRAIDAQRGVYLPEEPEMGAVTGERLMALADEIDEGAISAPRVARALATIRMHAGPPR